MEKKSGKISETAELLGYEPKEATSEGEESLWEQKLPELLDLERAREERRVREEREAAADVQVSLGSADAEPLSIAREMKARSDALRSRPMGPGWFSTWEKQSLLGLDLVEAKARTLALQIERGLLGAAEARRELELLSCSALAARQDSAALTRALDETIPQGAKPQDPEERRRALELIENFLREKRAKVAAGSQGWPRKWRTGG